MGCGCGVFSSGVSNPGVSNPGLGQDKKSDIVAGFGQGLTNTRDYNKTTNQIGQRTTNNNIGTSNRMNVIQQSKINIQISCNNNSGERINFIQKQNTGSQNTNTNIGIRNENSSIGYINVNVNKNANIGRINTNGEIDSRNVYTNINMVNTVTQCQNKNNEVTTNPILQSQVRKIIPNNKISPRKRAQTLQKNTTENNLLRPRNRSTQKLQQNPQYNPNDENKMLNQREIQENRRKNKIDRDNRALNEAGQKRRELKQTGSYIVDDNQNDKKTEQQQIPVPFNQSTIQINLNTTYPVKQSPINIKVENSITQNPTNKIKKTNSMIFGQANEEIEDKDKGKFNGNQNNDEGKGKGVDNDKHAVLRSTMMVSNDSMMMKSLSSDSVLQSRIVLKFN